MTTIPMPCTDAGLIDVDQDAINIWIPEVGLAFYTFWCPNKKCGHPHHGPVAGDTITRLQPARGVIRETRLDRCTELVAPERFDNRDHTGLLAAQERFWAANGSVELDATDEARRWATALLLALKAQEGSV